MAYDGAPFAGWARQRDARTVAGELDGAILAVDPRASRCRGVSRTDAGVHARSQWAAFDPARSLPTRGWLHALTQQLPREIAIVRAARAPRGFDPRRHSVDKHYRYTLLLSAVRDPFLEGRAWRLPGLLDTTLMASAAQALVGEHDFRAFRAAADEREQTRRRLSAVSVRQHPGDPRRWEIDVEGDRFMHHMVRIIVGSLVDIGRGRLAPEALGAALATGERRALGVTAPAEGLCLMRVRLDAVGVDAWPPERKDRSGAAPSAERGGGGTAEG